MLRIIEDITVTCNFFRGTNPQSAIDRRNERRVGNFIKKAARCQTYHRLLRWIIFSPEWMLSQVLKVVLGRVYS